AAAPAPPSPLRQVVREQAGRVERDAILNALRAASGNKSLAARRLNISRGALYNKIRALGIGEPRPS
ncbi:MAG: sigma-54-dependent Fis family transcriptional regulator, partial [Planctomycetes bacterium]|nr:sigma-54-dependent Fis family transcriptional regulator [Planctomycetota bacterium]